MLGTSGAAAAPAVVERSEPKRWLFSIHYDYDYDCDDFMIIPFIISVLCRCAPCCWPAWVGVCDRDFGISVSLPCWPSAEQELRFVEIGVTVCMERTGRVMILARLNDGMGNARGGIQIGRYVPRQVY
jgi:hypothetical protein